VQFTGHLPEDAPDPRLEQAARVRDLPFAVMGLVPQPTLEDWDGLGMEGTGGSGGHSHQAVSISYTLWRNPEDRDDPANLAELDDQTRASLDVKPPWPRPVWLLDMVERMRYPMLWEAVRTSWYRESSEHSTLEYQLVHHTNHILMNRFREELGLDMGRPAHEGSWRATEASINRSAFLVVNGVETAACEIDTDPFVYAVGVRLAPDLVATAVIPREFLPHVRVELDTRESASA
jgi:hypothetical protein